MAVTHRHDLRKPTGGRKRYIREKKKYEMGSLPTNTTIGKTSKVTKKQKGGAMTIKLKHADEANVLDPKTKAYKKAKIKTEIENKANVNLARRNILTKGAIIDTEAGKARITSRPGQHGVVNAILLEDQTYGDKKKSH